MEPAGKRSGGVRGTSEDGEGAVPGEAVPTLVGAVVIAAVLRDVVHELFSPESSGSISRLVSAGVWRGVRALCRISRVFMYRAGPLCLVAVALAWTSLTVLAFALIYWPRLPASFHVDHALPPSAQHGFATAVYVSLASVTTVGASDVTPQTTGLRLAVTLEALMGLVIVTAWITWVLSVYPVLAERRAFTREIIQIRKVFPDPDRAVLDAPREAITGILLSLGEQVLSVGTRLGQSRVSYYFQNESPQLSLVAQLPYVLALARAAQRVPDASAVRHHGQLLCGATEQVLKDMGTEFLGLKDPSAQEALEAIARDHLLPDAAGKHPGTTPDDRSGRGDPAR
jgi:voltage-gated potassium channel Kch